MPAPRRRYPTDLTDREWALLAPLIPAAKPGGRPALHDHRELVDAMLYWLRAGGAWRLLPHDFPPWQTVYHYWRLWRRQGLWERILARLREQERLRQGRNPTPARRCWTARASRPPKKGAARLRRRQEAQAAASGTCWSTRWGWSARRTSLPRTQATATVGPGCLAAWTGGGFRGCGMAGWIRATAGSSWPGVTGVTA